MKCPPIVDETREGIRAIMEIIRNSCSLIRVRPAKYVSKSFGVPGIKNSRKIIRLSFSSLLMKRSSSIFSRLMNISTSRTPKNRVSRNTSEEAAATPIMQMRVPSTAPKA